MMKHLIPALFLAVAGALASAWAVLWFPTTAGEVITGTALAVVIAWWLGKHRHAKRGLEAGLCGAVLAAALIALLPSAVPPVVFLVMMAPTAAHHLNPRRVRPVRTTRGVKSPAAKAAGGRAGRPGEKAHKSRARRTSSSSSAQSRPSSSSPAHAAASSRSTSPGWPPAPGGPPAASWPHATGDVSPATFLPWAGEDARPMPDWSGVLPRKLRKDGHRPGPVARSLCGDCIEGHCNRCRDRGCECPRSGHPLRPGKTAAPVTAEADPNEEVPF